MQVTTATLENLRRLKTRHQRLLSQVTTAREELEDYLKDDDDMAKMCLTRKRDQAQAWAAAAMSQSNGARFHITSYGCWGPIQIHVPGYVLLYELLMRSPQCLFMHSMRGRCHMSCWQVALMVVFRCGVGSTEGFPPVLQRHRSQNYHTAA